MQVQSHSRSNIDHHRKQSNGRLCGIHILQMLDKVPPESCRFKEMREANQPMAEVALNLYRECLRKVLMQRGGYECQETEGSFMLSFYNCIDAVQFCILVSIPGCNLGLSISSGNLPQTTFCSGPCAI